jgi:hypothetical protein
MGIHAFSTEIALQTCSDAREDDLLSNVKLRHARSDLLDYSNALMAENASVGHGGKVSLQNVKIGPANGRSGNPHNGIARVLDVGTRFVLPRSLAGTVINQRFHRSAGM